jgi:hypothetical protein
MMQGRMIGFTQGILKSLAWYLFYDREIELPLTKRLPGTNLSIQEVFSSEMMEGDFLDYNIEIEPYSMSPKTPSQRLQTISQVFSQFIAPFADAMSAQGITPNFEGLLKTIGRYADMPELVDILNYGQTVAESPTAPVAGPRETTRRYERVNRPGATKDGKNDVMMRLLLGGNPQSSEMASLGRPVG